MISLYESIFSAVNPSAARNVADAAYFEGIKNDLFFAIIDGGPAVAKGSDQVPNPKMKLSISDDGILTMPLRRSRNTEIKFNMRDPHNTMSILNKYDISGFNFVPMRKGPAANVEFYMDCDVKQDLDMKTSHGPLKIINTDLMFETCTICDRKNLNWDKAYDAKYVKNLILSGKWSMIYLQDRILDNCVIEDCDKLDLNISKKDPGVLANNCKINTSKVNIFIGTRGDNGDRDLFNAWKNYLFDGHNIRKDLLKRLGLDPVKSFALEISVGKPAAFGGDDNYSNIYMCTEDMRRPTMTDTTKYKIPGISAPVIIRFTGI